MDSDRPIVSRTGERPVTRWRRDSNERTEPLYVERPASGLSRSFSKMERPSSRRGVKNDITEYGISRPPTSGYRNMPSRPASPSIYSRVPTAGSRLNSANLSPMNSGLPRNFTQPNIMVLDRPVTQQGLAGVRPGSARAIPKVARQIQDRKYYKQMLQNRIQELNQEMITMDHLVSRQLKERPTSAYYDQRAKDVSVELRELQDQLTDYYSNLDKLTSGLDKDELEQEAMEFRESNEQREAEIERIFKKRQLAESKLKQFNEEIDSEFENDGNDVDNTNVEPKGIHNEARREKIELQKEMSELQEEYEQLLRNLSFEKSRMMDKTSHSTMKQEAFKLYTKIFEAEKRKNRLLEEHNPNGERPRTARRSQNHSNISSAERQMIEIEKKIIETKQELEQLETDSEITPPRRQSMNNNFQKREESLGNSANGRSRATELETLSRLEEQILSRLEQISNTIDENIDNRDVLTSDELELLRTLMDQSFGNRNDKNFEELKQEGIKLRQISRKLEFIELKLKTGVNKTVDHSEIVNEIDEQKQRKLIIQKEEFFDRDKKTDDEFDEFTEDYKQLRDRIEKNEIYRPISILEDKLAKFSSENVQKRFSEEVVNQDDSSLKEKLFSLVAQYNNILIADMKLVY